MWLPVLLLAAGLQQAPPPLPPSEALAAAMGPFNAARAQADDLTAADTLALGVGISRAARDCAALTAKPEDDTHNAPEVLALAKLCLFGQQFDPARAAAVRYIALADPKEHEPALLILIRAFLGLKEPGSALPQWRSLVLNFPYDANIQFAGDQILDATAGASPGYNDMALQVCGKQDAVTLPLLAGGKALPGKEASASASFLFSDAVRCWTLARATGDSAAATLKQLEAVPELPAWQGSAELAPMREALARVRMLGRPSPLPALHAHALSAGQSPQAVPLARGAVVLVPCTLWAPSTASILRTLRLSAPGQRIYAVTSWAANTGGADAPNENLLAGMREFRRGLPAGVPLLLVPDGEFRLLHEDAFPAGVVMREGQAAANLPLTGEAAVRLLLIGIQGRLLE